MKDGSEDGPARYLSRGKDWMGNTLPALNPRTHVNNSPHVVILGAGASRAAMPNGDASGNRIPLMADLFDCLELRPLLKRHGVNADGADFEAMYDHIASDTSRSELKAEIERRTQAYFSSLILPSHVTLYDILVLSLREKDCIASFNWDPFLAQAWQRNSTVANLPNILFLHGNVKTGICREHKVKNFLGSTCSKCGRVLEPTTLLYPVEHKDYNQDSFIRNEWEELKIFLENAYILTIFGYSAPRTDIEARELLLRTWTKNPSFNQAEIEIVDIRPERELKEQWGEFFCREHYGILRTVRHSYLYRHPRRSCDAFAMAYLQCDPWYPNCIPSYRRLERLQKWMRQLWNEERTGYHSGIPFGPVDDRKG